MPMTGHAPPSGAAARPHARRPLAAALGFALAVLLPAVPLTAQQPERYTLAGDEVAVYDLAGVVELVPGTGSEVVVAVRRGGRDADALRIAAGDVGGREALRVIFPDDDIVYPALRGGHRTSLRVRGDGTFGDDDRSDLLGFGSNRVTVRGSGTGVEAYADLRVEVPAGRRIQLFLGAGRAFVRNVNGAVRVDAAAAPVVAEGTRGPLWIDTGSGRVSVADANGDVEIDTGSGSVDVSRVNGRRLYIDTGSGSVSAGDVTADEVEIDTGSGSIEVARVTAGEVSLDTGSGSIDVELLADIRSLLVDTGSGGVTVSVPQDIGAEIEIDTGSGGIDLDLPVTVSRIERSHFRGRLGDGSGRIEIDTGSGSVRLTGS